MASGRLGALDLAANSDTTLYAPSTGITSTVNINICNRNATDVSIRIAVISGILANSDYIEYDVLVPGNGVLERTGIVVFAGQSIVVRSNTANVSVVCWGFED